MPLSVPGTKVLTAVLAGLGRATLTGSMLVVLAQVPVAAQAPAQDQATCRTGGDDAIAACSRLINLNPRVAFGFAGRGSAYNTKHDYDRAIADFSQAIRLDPRNATAFNGRGF